MKKRFITMLLTSVILSTAVGGVATVSGEEVAPEDIRIGEYNWPIDTTLDYSQPYYKRFDGVEFTTVTAADGSTLPEGHTFSENEMTWFFQAITGMKPNVIWNDTNGTEGEKWNAAVASGEIPDFMRVNYSQYIKLVEAGLVADMTDYFDELLSPSMKAAYEAGDNMALEGLMVDGRIYGIPQINALGDGNPLFWIRKDWMDKLGLEEPKCLADVETIAKAFVEQDPDGDEQDDTAGIGMLASYSTQNGGAGDVSSIFLNAGGAAPDIWVKQDDGNVIYGSLMEGAKEALTLLNDWYTKGLIPADFATLTWDDLNAMVTNDELGICMGAWYEPVSILGNSVTVDSEAEWVSYALPAEEGGTYYGQGGGPTFGIFVVNKDFEDPSMFIHALNAVNDTRYFREVVTDFSQTISNEHNVFNECLSPGFYAESMEVMEMVANGELETEEEFEEEFFKHGIGLQSLCQEFINMVIPTLKAEDDAKRDVYAYDGTTWCYGLYNARYTGVKGMIDANPTWVVTDFQGNTESMSMYGTFLDTLEKDAYTNMIMGNTDGMSISEYFDEFVENYLAQGGAQITAEVQAAVDAR